MKLKLLITVLFLNCAFFANSKNIEIPKNGFFIKKIVSPITASNSGNTCQGSSFNLFSTSAGSDYTYSWTGPNGFTSNQQNPLNIFISGTGSFTYTVTATNGSITETASTTITIFSSITPIFNPFAPICQGSVPPVLPALSAEGIPGIWSPSIIDSNLLGTQIITFTPDFGYCALPVTMSIEIIPNAIPSILDIAVCDSYTLPPLAFGNYYSQPYGNGQIINAGTVISETQEVFVFGNTSSSCDYNDSFNVFNLQNTQPLITSNSNNNILCVDFDTNIVETPILLQLNNLNFQNVSYQWYENGIPIPNAINSTLLIDFPLSNSSQSNFSVSVSNNNCTTISYDYYIYQYSAPVPIGIGYSIVNDSGNQTLTVEVEGYGNIFYYVLDGVIFQNTSVFTNVGLGLHTIEVNANGICGGLTLQNIVVNAIPTPAPTGNQVQSFIQGATLADVVVNGENIKWYDSQNPNAKVTSTFNVELPLNTVLVDGTTYYASQKIGGYESIQRLPVTVQTTLKNDEFANGNFVVSPNPVENNLIILSKNIIKNITVYNFLGQLLIEKNADLNEINLDLSAINSGYYLVKIATENEISTVKILKK